MNAWTAEADTAFLASADGTPPTERPALLSVSDLENLPAPKMLLGNILPEGFLVMFGPSGVGKSFLAMDWALCVATGLSWYGQQVQQGWVLHIAAEGASGLWRRVEAWQHARGHTGTEAIRFHAGAVNFLDPKDVSKLKAAIKTMPAPPTLIVIDTLARCMVGGDENTAKDVGLYIAAVDELRATYNASALTVHHTGRDGEDERGSSALRGAADAMLALRADGAGLKLQCVKEKDAEAFEPWRLHLENVAESCVLRCGTPVGLVSGTEREMLESVSAAFGTQWAAATAFRDASGSPRSSYYRNLKSLTDKGLVEAEDESRHPRYRLTETGQQRVSPSPNESHGTAEASPTNPPSLRGVGLGTELGLDGNLSPLSMHDSREGDR